MACKVKFRNALLRLVEFDSQRRANRRAYRLVNVSQAVGKFARCFDYVRLTNHRQRDPREAGRILPGGEGCQQLGRWVHAGIRRRAASQVLDPALPAPPYEPKDHVADAPPAGTKATARVNSIGTTAISTSPRTSGNQVEKT